MKKELDIYEPYVKELWGFYNDDYLHEYPELTFGEFLLCESAGGPEIEGMLETGGWCPPNENSEEYENMTEAEQREEYKLRFLHLIKRCGEILGKEFPVQTYEEIEKNAIKVLRY